jgi:DNA modification methylase
MTVRILTGDVRERLAELPDGSVQCCVTSPPYFGLRDYGTAAWSGGSDDCDHIAGRGGHLAESRASTRGGANKVAEAQSIPYRDVCGKCGAVRQDRQIGLEATLAEYVQTMVEVFREVRRVLRDDGVLWLNLGDSYNTAASGGFRPGSGRADGEVDERGQRNRNGTTTPGLKPKDLMMVPARVALALQDDGWYLRSDVIWHKPNPMPESVTDRPTSAHEHIFLLTKRSRYFFDADAIREENAAGSQSECAIHWRDRPGNGEWPSGTGGRMGSVSQGRNCRNVWTMATAPYKEAHFATFPPELPRRCILAGSSEKGACAACGAPWVRCVERREVDYPNGLGNGTVNKKVQVHGTVGKTSTFMTGKGTVNDTTGWRAGCECDAGAVPCVVLDPFAGAGTALLVADRLGRDAIGVELNPEYAALIERRLKEDAPMFVELERTDVRPAQAAMLL